jgi:hypothetical protein
VWGHLRAASRRHRPRSRPITAGTRFFDDALHLATDFSDPVQLNCVLLARPESESMINANLHVTMPIDHKGTPPSFMSERNARFYA